MTTRRNKNRQNKKFKKGNRFDKWALISFIASGGNGEVWKCQDNNGLLGAIKILKKVNALPYARFLGETKVLEDNADIQGIVPLIDKYLPTQIKSSIPFYVMPLAENAEKKLKGLTFEEKIDAILEISRTLQILHSRGISHRDIKPSNLLYYNSRFSLADFGLADYPSKKDISPKDQEIGAKWTMAPEMKRHSSTADGLKADIYSLAKTLWIVLTEKPKGFDGQYSPELILELRSTYKTIYTSPIDKLLADCTSQDPEARPNINDFILSLEHWKILNEDFHSRNQEQWFEVQQKLFPLGFPKRVIWEDINDIINVLKVVCSYRNLNHTFFPGSGGMDLEDIRLSHEKGCIELDCQLIEIVKPKRLLFESFGTDPEWNFFRLELDELEPSDVHKAYVEREQDTKVYHRESVSEIYPGQYEEYDIYDNRDYYKEIGYDIPETARHVTRWFRGTFVIFNKRSTYNMDSSTYDGRHNKMSTEEFREYIESNIEMAKALNDKDPWYKKLLDHKY